MHCRKSSNQPGRLLLLYYHAIWIRVIICGIHGFTTIGACRKQECLSHRASRRQFIYICPIIVAYRKFKQEFRRLIQHPHPVRHHAHPLLCRNPLNDERRNVSTSWATSRPLWCRSRHKNDQGLKHAKTMQAQWSHLVKTSSSNSVIKQF